MLRNFAAIILPFVALAKGDGSGEDADNATTLALIDVNDGGSIYKLTLNHYNTYQFDDAEYVFNGSLELETDDASKFWEVGFCMQVDLNNDQKWDCYTNTFEIGATET